jgi:hypothetical protein
MSIFSRREPESDSVRVLPEFPLREALRRADPELEAELGIMAADRFGVRNTLEQKQAAHAGVTIALHAAIVRVYQLAEQHRASTEDLLESAQRGRVDVEAKLEFINQIERSLKGANHASIPDTSSAPDDNGGAGSEPSGAVPSVPDTAAGGTGLQGQAPEVPADR